MAVTVRACSKQAILALELIASRLGISSLPQEDGQEGSGLLSAQRRVRESHVAGGLQAVLPAESVTLLQDLLCTGGSTLSYPIAPGPGRALCLRKT